MNYSFSRGFLKNTKLLKWSQTRKKEISNLCSHSGGYKDFYLCNLSPNSLWKVSQCFRTTYYFHLHSQRVSMPVSCLPYYLTLKMKATHSSKMLDGFKNQEGTLYSRRQKYPK
jgi:hypothetical protein